MCWLAGLGVRSAGKDSGVAIVALRERWVEAPRFPLDFAPGAPSWRSIWRASTATDAVASFMSEPAWLIVVAMPGA
jgi:hypothetical protein